MSEPVVARAAPAAASGEKAVGDALAYLLRSTTRRPQTRAELVGKLQARGVDDDVAASALDRAAELGAVDDAAFARAWVEDRGRNRGYGRARLREELRRRRVPDALAEEALTSLDERDDLTAATALARRRVASIPATVDPAVVARRLEGFLLRRGYVPALARRVAVAVSGYDRHRHWD